MAENNLKFDLPTMLDLHRFGDIYAAGIRGIRSETAAFELIREAKDSIGPHWYGMRCRVTSKKTGVNFYLHTGLIFLPATQIGLMVEVDERNNLAVYDTVVAKLPEGRLYTINRAEKEYFKLFMFMSKYFRSFLTQKNVYYIICFKVFFYRYDCFNHGTQ